MQHSPSSPAVASANDVSGEWSGDNQDWWNWYVSLAENERSTAPLVDPPALPDVAWPGDDELAAELAEPFALSASMIGTFRRNGFIKLARCFIARCRLAPPR